MVASRGGVRGLGCALGLLGLALGACTGAPRGGHDGEAATPGGGTGAGAPAPGAGGGAGAFDAGGSSAWPAAADASTHPASMADAGGLRDDAGGAPLASGYTPPAGHMQYVFVITMENHDARSIVGNSADASYLNGTLLARYASASHYTDVLPISVLSEPHYIWMEAGTNAFADHTFGDDSEPSASNSTSSSEHLVTQIEAAGGGLDWRSYQEGLDDKTGACPIHGSGFYQPKHDPFVFFHDVSGDPPSATNLHCAQHHAPLDALAGDLAHGRVPRYVFITPNLCHDMHGQSGCPDTNTIRAGDQWLASALPALIDFANAHDGVIFIVWDEGEKSTTTPFLAIGPRVVPGRVSAVQYSHSSLLKSIEEILDLPVLPAVASSEDFADLFGPGRFP